jgi:putative nucleotidyltransferase with HDIG domain
MYFAVDRALLQSNVDLNFDVYLQMNENYVLYAKKGQNYSTNLNDKLKEKGVQKIYIEEKHKHEYEKYINNNFSVLLSNDDISIETRSEVFYNVAVDTINDLLDRTMLKVNSKDVHSLYNLTKVSINLLKQENAIKNIGCLFSHDHKTYLHCLRVYVLLLALMNNYNFDEEERIWSGVGAMLHDMGKLKIPTTILNKPGRLNDEEWKYIKHHPVLGLGCCSQVKLSQEAVNSILFHHEKCDGSGYPVGLAKKDIPLPVRMLTVCDVYDAITSHRPYASRESSQQALRIMESEMSNSLDMNIFDDLTNLVVTAELN